MVLSRRQWRETWSSVGQDAGHPWRVQVPTEDMGNAESRGQGRVLGGSPRAQHPPPAQGPVTVMKEHVSHITASGQHKGGEAGEEPDFAISRASRTQQPPKRQNQVSEPRLREKVIRPCPSCSSSRGLPYSTEQGGWGPQIREAFCSQAASQGRARCPGP